MHPRPRIPSFASPRQQRGAVLYFALIMLILLALIGIAGMQVTGMRERMAANYLRSNQAFQNAESSARAQEAVIQAAIGSGNIYEANQEECSPVFDPATWADGKTTATAINTRRLDKCVTRGPIKVGVPKNEETENIYQITVLASDDPANPSSSAVIDTIYIP